MLRVAIVGCGKISDQHAAQIGRIPGCSLVAACDREPELAAQLAERFGVPRVYDDLGEMLRQGVADVVHITTPPHTHFELAEQCLNYGCHVYVEKPLTLNAGDAASLLAGARQSGLRVAVGHNVQFSPEMIAMRRAVRDGLVGTVRHVESTFSYDLGDPSYVAAVLGDPTHWVRNLPGQLLHNVISHGVAKIVEFIATDEPQVVAHGFASAALRQLGEHELNDELRVLISGEDGMTAYFTFTTQVVPPVQEFRVYGDRGSLQVDNQHRTLIQLNRKNSQYKSFLNFFLPPRHVAKALNRNVRANIRSFLRRDFHIDAGMKNLIQRFYDAIEGRAPVPFPDREILLTCQIMDEIFSQLRAAGRRKGVAPERVDDRRAEADSVHDDTCPAGDGFAVAADQA